MGTFTKLDREQGAALVARFGLGDLRSLSPIAAGTINSNFRIETEQGTFFLRINEGKALAQVRYEAELVMALADAGVATPRPLLTKDGAAYAEESGQFVTVFSWTEGAHRVPPSADDCRSVGAALAGLHRAGAPLADKFPGRGIYTFDHIVARFESIAESGDTAIVSVLPELRDEIAWLSAQPKRELPEGVVHNDLFPDNVLFAEDGSLALLDFEQASIGRFVFDLAVCINAWCWQGSFDLAKAKAMVEGYATTRPLGDAEWDALYKELRWAALRFTITRITDVYLPRVDLPDKDFRDYLARLQQWIEWGEARVVAALS